MAIRTDCLRNCSCLVNGLGYVRFFTVLVQGDEDGSGVMKSCFVVIVVNNVVGRVGGDKNRLLEEL